MTTNAPLVSVLLPVRDGLPYLYEAAESITSQELTDLEVIAVDDGSTDGTDVALAEWAARDGRVRIVTQEASGIVSALEAARSRARGRFLARMDADDVSDPARLTSQLALMVGAPDLVACGTGVEYFPAEVVRDGARRYQEWINAANTPDLIERHLFVECPLPHPTFFLRADAVAAVGGYRDVGWPEDYDLVLRLWEAGGRLGKVPTPLLRWRERAGRLSRTDDRYAPDRFLACKVHYLLRTLLSGRDSVVIWGAGPVGKSISVALRGHGVGVAAFVEVDPRKIGQEIHGAPVIDTEEGLTRRGPYHLAAVGQPGARARLETLLEGAGLTPLADFAAVA